MGHVSSTYLWGILCPRWLQNIASDAGSESVLSDDAGVSMWFCKDLRNGQSQWHKFPNWFQRLQPRGKCVHATNPSLLHWLSIFAWWSLFLIGNVCRVQSSKYSIGVRMNTIDTAGVDPCGCLDGTTGLRSPMQSIGVACFGLGLFSIASCFT